MRYFIEFSYKGTAYNGWQKQKNSLGIQEILEDAFGKVLRQPVEITGSSRTDAGVHAEQQFAHFDTELPIVAPDLLVHSINGMIPRDIAVKSIRAVNKELNSRFAATHRRYEYRIIKNKNPFLINEAYLLRGDLDVVSMNAAAGFLLGLHDFESFSKIHTEVNHFRCTVSTAEWTILNDKLIFKIQANRFLRGMVRAIVGTLLEVGRGKRTVEGFKEVLQARDRKAAGPQAPAEGLFLVEVGYPAAIFNESVQA
ncbi:tRNA pseudouridine synthase A [Dyadobacter sp. CECT 9275]|uniref:tRNA pseudouridine synthase A n=1 Tax=Dyadobacter helix TaxID=2822344 RepID=A0A916J967_9BACT|nr:tRNA pseudouridine(38-40) synthase TruA [Dyadobacter sp. CECT 9275]CAG4993050.1 tRNA pseudouridine synthase A [Dyadobacter sp. CECT 9275]